MLTEYEKNKKRFTLMPHIARIPKDAPIAMTGTRMPMSASHGLDRTESALQLLMLFLNILVKNNEKKSYRTA